MSHWNYRVMRDSEGIHRIHEHYVHDQGDYAWTQNGMVPTGESLDDLRLELERMLAAFDKPVLDHETGLELISNVTVTNETVK